MTGFLAQTSPAGSELANLAKLAAQMHQPFELAKQANQMREHLWGQKGRGQVQIRLWSKPAQAGLVCNWTRANPSDTPLLAYRGPVQLEVNCERSNDRLDFLRWLACTLEQDPAWTHVGAYSQAPSSTHRNWLLAACRILLPPSIRVEARVDKIGPRNAQLALNFGVDTLACPQAEQKRLQLPLAGVASPNETSRHGLATLIEQAGLTAANSPS